MKQVDYALGAPPNEVYNFSVENQFGTPLAFPYYYVLGQLGNRPLCAGQTSLYQIGTAPPTPVYITAAIALFGNRPPAFVMPVNF